jgi:hypothetical protein
METFEVTLGSALQQPLGMTFEEDKNLIILKHVAQGSAAEQAGLQSGCILSSVNGKPIVGMKVRQATLLVEGKVHDKATPTTQERVLVFLGPTGVAMAAKAAAATKAAAARATAEEASAIATKPAACKGARAKHSSASDAGRLDTSAREDDDASAGVGHWKKARQFFMRQEIRSRVVREVEWATSLYAVHPNIDDLDEESSGQVHGLEAPTKRQDSASPSWQSKRKVDARLPDDTSLNLSRQAREFARRRSRHGGPIICVRWTMVQRIHHVRMDEAVRELIQEHVRDSLQAAIADRLDPAGANGSAMRYSKGRARTHAPRNRTHTSHVSKY